MSIHGIGYPTRPLANAPLPARDGVHTGPRATSLQSERMRPAIAPATLRPNAPAAGTATPAPALEAPPGTDPELWKVLSTEERAYFARLGAMGPLTYGRMMDAPAAAPSMRGGRLDVKA